MLIYLLQTPLTILIWIVLSAIGAWFLESMGVKSWLVILFLMFTGLAIAQNSFTLTTQPGMKPPVGYVYIAPDAGEKINDLKNLTK